MDANDKRYFDTAFRLIQLRLTNLETQVTLLFNVEKKRIGDEHGKSIDQVNKDLEEITRSVHNDLTHMAEALKAHTES